MIAQPTPLQRKAFELLQVDPAKIVPSTMPVLNPSKSRGIIAVLLILRSEVPLKVKPVSNASDTYEGHCPRCGPDRIADIVASE